MNNQYRQSEAAGITCLHQIAKTGQGMGAESPEAFAPGVCFYKMVWIFALGSIFGYVVETIFCFAFKGYLESRQGMLYGPFNQIYGFGAVLLALILLRAEKKGNASVFFVSALSGGVFEIVCSFIQQHAFGTVSWDYKWMPFSIGGGRTNLLYMIFWGLLGLVYIRLVYPVVSAGVERLPAKPGAVLSWIITVFLAVNMCLSATAVYRWSERQANVPASSGLDRFIDTHYPDETLRRIYPSMMQAE